VYLEKKDGEPPRVTPAGAERLQDLVTDVAGDVYAIQSGLSPVMAAAAMARLSRNANDMRVVILDEFAGKEGEDEALLRRVITGYGDDSVQQLVGVQLAVENASNLLTKQLEWGRLASYLEQSTRYIYFDQKDGAGRYKYYVPAGLDDIEAEYCRVMDQIFDVYSEMVRGITEYVREKNPQGEDQRIPWMAATRAQACDAVRTVLPAATRSTVGIFGSAQAIDNLIMNLMSQPLEEARVVGQKILNEVRKVVPAFFERTDLPERGGGTVAYKAETREALRRLAQRFCRSEENEACSEETVRLVSHTPEVEWELAPELLFDATGFSLDELGASAFVLEDDEIDEIFKAYIGERLNRRHKPGRAFEIPHYEWEIVADYGTFRDIQRHRMVDAMEWQRLTPFNGYGLPQLVEEAGYVDQFNLCFSLSQGLYRNLVEAGFEVEAQYATLMGHRMRYRFLTNAREAYHLIELRSTPQGHPGYRRIAQLMYEEILKVHPRIAAGMKFVGLDEDPSLTRLAAERATAFKLQQLEGN
jgi:thymidylate synthase ThyX